MIAHREFELVMVHKLAFGLYIEVKREEFCKNVLRYYKLKFAMRDHKARYLSDGHKKRCKITGVNTESGALVVQTKKSQTFEISSPTNVILPKTVKVKKRS